MVHESRFLNFGMRYLWKTLFDSHHVLMILRFYFKLFIFAFWTKKTFYLRGLKFDKEKIQEDVGNQINKCFLTNIKYILIVQLFISSWEQDIFGSICLDLCDISLNQVRLIGIFWYCTTVIRSIELNSHLQSRNWKHRPYHTEVTVCCWGSTTEKYLLHNEQ